MRTFRKSYGLQKQRLIEPMKTKRKKGKITKERTK